MKKFLNGFFLDRDGILNKLINGRPPWKISEIFIFEEAYDLIKIIKEKNYIPIIVTNQPDEARGVEDFDTEEVNNEICKKLDLHYSYICKHPFDGLCNCRKPKPGLLIKACNEISIDISNSFMLGDREKDINAGKIFGCKTILLSSNKNCEPDFSVENHTELISLLKEIL